MTTITIVLHVRGDATSAHSAVEAALDDGVLQDAINDYDDAVEVVSAVMVDGTDEPEEA